MNVVTIIVSTNIIRYAGTLAGRTYDMYKQIREDARHGKTMVRYIRRYHKYLDDSLEGFEPRVVRPVEKSAWLFEPSNNWQCQKIDGFMLWFGSWEIKPYNRNFWKFQNTQSANCYMLLQIPICYLLLLYAISICY